MIRELRDEISDNWRDGEKKTLIFVYYAGHGMITKMTDVVCNGGLNKRGKHQFTYPLESQLRSVLAIERGAYVLSIFDCCREILPPGSTRGGLEHDEGQDIDMSMQDYYNILLWFGC